MTAPFGTKFNPFSSSFRSQLNEVGSYAMDWGMNGDDIKRRVAENFPNLGGGVQPFLAQLNDAEPLPRASNRWKYAWEAYVPGIVASTKGYPGQGSSATSDTSTWAPISGRLSSMVHTAAYGAFAVNGAEVANSSSGHQSYGVKTGTGPSGSGTVSLLSVGNLESDVTDEYRMVIVPMFRMVTADSTRDSDYYWFSAANEAEVTCT
jgi:hypothetical protein